jgi:hypothetical protein
MNTPPLNTGPSKFYTTEQPKTSVVEKKKDVPKKIETTTTTSTNNKISSTVQEKWQTGWSNSNTSKTFLGSHRTFVPLSTTTTTSSIDAHTLEIASKMPRPLKPAPAPPAPSREGRPALGTSSSVLTDKSLTMAESVSSKEINDLSEFLPKLDEFKAKYKTFIQGYDPSVINDDAQMVNELAFLTEKLFQIDPNKAGLPRHINDLSGLTKVHLIYLDQNNSDTKEILTVIDQNLTDLKTLALKSTLREIKAQPEKSTDEAPKVGKTRVSETMKATKARPSSEDLLGNAIELKAFNELLVTEINFQQKMTEAGTRLSVLIEITTTIKADFDEKSYNDAIKIFKQAKTIYDDLSQSSQTMLEKIQTAIPIFDDPHTSTNTVITFGSKQIADVFSSKEYFEHLTLLARAMSISDSLQAATQQFDNDKIPYEYSKKDDPSEANKARTLSNIFNDEMEARLPNKSWKLHSNADVFIEPIQRAPRYAIQMEATAKELGKKKLPYEEQLIKNVVTETKEALVQINRSLKPNQAIPPSSQENTKP